ncbi:uncharacterized protein LOC116805331 [Drosophila grimshawi]|uniref:uncharacterized protein LOC116805331 n=1 Tax=Drosophila grimshawi TaxID=7222 RepID=UPI000C87072B|nr:uncharacterized protein LOC116805331 [Drosophila grimshawi]
MWNVRAPFNSDYSTMSQQLDEASEECSPALDQHLMRTQLLLLDYKQFKAARSIQRFYRGWQVRHLIEKQRHAAIVIQRSWRSFTAMRHFALMAQIHTQTTIVDMFNDSSLKIQKLFRGWWSRKYINNMLYLKNMQFNCLENVLNDCALKLHSLHRSALLPGYYDFCEDHLRTKVDALVTSLSYRLYNRYMANKYATAKSFQAQMRHQFLDSAYWTSVPYPGFSHTWNIETKVYGLREYDVAREFTAESEINYRKKNQLKSTESKLRIRSVHSNENSFCADLIARMKLWHVCEECKLLRSEDLKKINITEILDHIKNRLEELNCNCQRDKHYKNPLQSCK